MHISSVFVAVFFVASLTGCGKKETSPPAAEAQPAPAAAEAEHPAAEPAPEAETTSTDTDGCSYTTTNQTVTGPCPTGRADSGSCELIQDGDQFRFVIKTGRTCNPASICTFIGTVADGKYIGRNEVTVDSEGGTVTNTVEFVVNDSSAGTGSGTSTYSHPGGTKCEWRYDLGFAQ